MRHLNRKKKFSMTTSHRIAMFRSLACAIIRREVVKTTLAKAKAIRGFLEPLITLAKEDTVARRRMAFDRLRDKDIVDKLFSFTAPRSNDRKGGYLRIIKNSYRMGDKAPAAIIEIVDRDKSWMVDDDSAEDDTTGGEGGGEKE